MTVTITFRPPPRQNPPDAPSSHRQIVHERRLDGVPPWVAWQIDDDFVRYQSNDSSQACRYNIYSYGRAGDKIEVALDFREIAEIKLSAS